MEAFKMVKSLSKNQDNINNLADQNHLGLTLDGESHFAMRAEEMHAYGGNAKAK